MVTLPVRNLAKLGVIADVEHWDLPLESFSMGVNVRFENGSVARGPVFRIAGPSAAPVRHMLGYEDSHGSHHMMIVAEDGSASEWRADGETPLSPTGGWQPSPSDASITSTIINEVVYINRSDRSPWYRPKSELGPFELLSDYDSGNGLAQLDATVRFKALRSTAGMLVGIGVSKGGVTYPTMVKWSNFTSYGYPPMDWDVGVTTSSAGENILSEMDGALVDAAHLGNNLLLYGTRETWLMEYVGGNDIFSFRRIFGAGVINTNCVVEHDNRHFVFGADDIYITDGISNRSIATGRVRKTIFGSLVQSERAKFFVFRNPNLAEIMFCYVSADKYCAFPYGQSEGCNRAAVYNYSEDTWSFYDLPYVCAAALGAAETGLTWDRAAMTWEQIGGSWSGQGDDAKKIVVSGGYDFEHADGHQPCRLRSLDTYTAGSTTGDIDLAATAPVYLEKSRMDLDEVGAELEGQKYISKIVPEARLLPDASPIVFTVGATNHPTVDPEWSLPQEFDHLHHRLDYDLVGRYLSMKIEYDDPRHFTLSGFDIDIVPLGY